MARAFFHKTLAGLAPADDAAREAVHGLGLGELVAVEISRPRNIQMHRLYWALCSAIADGIGAERETVSDVLKIKTGHCHTVKTKDGTYHLPRSISFSKMDQAEFNTFFDRCCALIISEWLPHMKATEVRLQVEDMVMGNSHSQRVTPHVKARQRRAA